MDRLHVATLNIRNLADRWFERLPLLLADMAALQPDLLGLQEVVYVMQQDRLIGAAGEGRYAAHRGWAGQPEYGNSLLVREPLAATAVERLDLGHKRAAHRALVGLPGGTTVLAVVTHLHHLTPDAAIRDEETAAILAWLADAPPADATLLMGDFNANPAEPAPGTLARGWLPVRLRRGQWRRTAGHVAVRAHRAGDGHRRRAGLPRLHLDPRRGPGYDGAAVLRPARSRGCDALPERPSRDRGPARDRVGEWPARHRSDSRTAAISGARRRTRSRRSPRRSRTRAATASSSTSASPPTASR